jgi:hypothetical protein
MRARSFSGDAEAESDDGQPAPAYSFEGYDVVFSVKIALTAPAAAKTAAPKRRAESP